MRRKRGEWSQELALACALVGAAVAAHSGGLFGAFGFAACMRLALILSERP